MTDQEFYLQLDGKLSREIAKWELPGAAYGVYQGGRIVHTGFPGYADLRQKRQANEHTLYQIGSVTKSFTAAACAVLADRGLLEWDRPVREYLPWLRFYDDCTSAQVSARDLLCHRTGLARHDEEWLEGRYSRRELVQLLGKWEPSWPFRSKWGYQNIGYVAAGCLIEALSGASWETFVEKELLEPLGMHRTTGYLTDMTEDKNHAEPYGRPDEKVNHGLIPVPYLYPVPEDREAGRGVPHGPAGSLNSCIGDLMKWLAFQLDGGKAGSGQLISKENFRQMHQPQMLMGGPLYLACPEQDFHAYGLGWMMEKYRGVKMIDHGGNVPGFGTLAVLVPELELGIAVCINLCDTTFGYALAYEITDHYLGAAGGDWFNRELAFMEARSAGAGEG